MNRANLEHDLREIWAVVLDCPVENIGADDNFFDLAGDSYSTLSLCLLVEKKFDVCLRPPLVIENPTITRLAGLVSRMLAQTAKRQD